MSSFPPTFIAQIDAAVQQGRGAAAQVLGQTYDVRRLNATTNNSVSSNAAIFTGFPAKVRRTIRKMNIENMAFDLLIFEALCDHRNLVLMDELTETGYGAQANATYIFAQTRPLTPTLLVRAENSISVTRPMPVAGQAAQQPASGSVVVPGWGGVEKSTEEYLVLANGLYSFATTGVPASVLAGLQPVSRVQDGRDPKIPTTFYRERFMAYLPMLPGVTLNELDRLNFPNSDRYEVALIFSTDLTGLAGYILIVEKLGT